MASALGAIVTLAARQDGVVSLQDLRRLGVPPSTCSGWVRRGELLRLGPRSFAAPGAPPTWRRDVRAAVIDVAPEGAAAGRTAARLHGLDGFGEARPIELLVPRRRRNVRSPHTVRSTSDRFRRGDVIIVSGVRCLGAERLILDAPLFWLATAEIERAIDSAIRQRLLSEQRLRRRVEERVGHRLNNHRRLVEALVDTGGESHLERRFLALLRAAGLPRPTLQRTFTDDGRFVARVDACYGDDLVIELAGHRTHSSREQIDHDEQRRNALTLQGRRVITFTHRQVTRRPAWVLATVEQALDALGVTEFASSPQIR